MQPDTKRFWLEFFAQTALNKIFFGGAMTGLLTLVVGQWKEEPVLTLMGVSGLLLSAAVLALLYFKADDNRPDHVNRPTALLCRATVRRKVLLPRGANFVSPSGVVSDADAGRVPVSEYGYPDESEDEDPPTNSPIMHVVQLEVTNQSSVDATKVRAHIMYLDGNGQTLHETSNSRWEGSPYASFPDSTSELRFTNIAARDMRRLDVAFKFRPDAACYAIDNDSPSAEQWKIDGYGVSVRHCRVAVVLSSSEFPDGKRYEFAFRNLGRGHAPTIIRD